MWSGQLLITLSIKSKFSDNYSYQRSVSQTGIYRSQDLVNRVKTLKNDQPPPVNPAFRTMKDGLGFFMTIFGILTAAPEEETLEIGVYC